MTSLLCVSAGCPCPQDPLEGPRAGSSMLFPVPPGRIGVRGASSPGPMCPHAFVLLRLTLPDTQPSPDTPTSHPPLPMLLHRWPPGHILRLQARPLFPEQRGVCAGSMCPRTTQGTQTCSQVQACSQGSLKLPSPGDSQPLPGHPAYHGNTVPPSGRRSMVSWICSL